MDSIPILTSAQALEAASAANRRAADRCSCTDLRLVRLVARPSFQSCAAFVHELSRAGLGLILPRPLDIGTLLALQLRKQHTGLSDILTAQVRHALALAGGQWHLGCCLSRHLTENEMYALVVGEAPDLCSWKTVSRNYRRS
jgi:hypothetical protein